MNGEMSAGAKNIEMGGLPVETEQDQRGSRESELNALTVTPTGVPSASAAVTTVTPLAKHPKVLRKVAASTVIIQLF